MGDVTSIAKRTTKTVDMETLNNNNKDEVDIDSNERKLGTKLSSVDESGTHSSGSREVEMSDSDEGQRAVVDEIAPMTSSSVEFNVDNVMEGTTSTNEMAVDCEVSADDEEIAPLTTEQDSEFEKSFVPDFEASANVDDASSIVSTGKMAVEMVGDVDGELATDVECTTVFRVSSEDICKSALSVEQSYIRSGNSFVEPEVVDKCSILKAGIARESLSVADKDCSLDEDCARKTDPEVTVLEIVSSPKVEIEPEAPDDVIDCHSSIGCRGDGSIDGDYDDDDDDDDTKNFDSIAGSPTTSGAATSQLAVPLVRRGGSHPAEVIEVVCGNQHARLDIRLLVAGLIRASNNTTSRAPCVLVDAAAVDAAAATEDGVASANQNDSGGGRVLTLTPNQFQKYSGRGTARDWKRSTRHHGVSLKSLISRKILILDPDSYGCYCNRCVVDSGHNPEKDHTYVSSPKSNDSVSIDQENLPPLSNDDDAPLSSLSPHQQLRRHQQTAATGARKRPSVSAIGASADDVVDDGGQPLSKRTKGSPGSSSTSMDDSEFEMVGGAWLKAVGSKEEKMANIIRELRNYKNNLAEKIDANRRHSTGSGPITDFSLVSGAFMSSSPVDSIATSGFQVGATISSPSDLFVKTICDTIVTGRNSESFPLSLIGRHLNYASAGANIGVQTTAASPRLPVTVSMSSQSSRSVSGGSTTSKQRTRRRSSQQYKTDEHGALDLTATGPLSSHGRSRKSTSKIAASKSVASNISAASATDDVLDLRVSRSAAVENVQPTPMVQHQLGSSLGFGVVPNWHPSASLFSAPNLQRMLSWTVSDVIDFASRVPGCGAYSETFRQFGIDGSSLALLSVDQMTSILGIRMEVAQALRYAVDCAVSSPPFTSPVPLASAAALSFADLLGGNSPVVGSINETH